MATTAVEVPFGTNARRDRRDGQDGRGVPRERASRSADHDRRGAARHQQRPASSASTMMADAADGIRRSGGCGAGRRLHAPRGHGVPRPGAQRDRRLDQQSRRDGRSRPRRDRPRCCRRWPTPISPTGWTATIEGAFPRLKTDTNAVAEKLAEIVGQLQRHLAQPQDGDGRNPSRAPTTSANAPPSRRRRSRRRRRPWSSCRAPCSQNAPNGQGGAATSRRP